MTREQLDALARDYFDKALEADEQQRRSTTGESSAYARAHEGEHPIDTDLEVLSTLLTEVVSALATNDTARVQDDATALLASAGAETDAGSDAHRELAHRLLRAQAELLRVAERRRRGDYTGTVSDPLFAAPALRTLTVEPPQSLPLSQVVEKYITAKQRDGKWGRLMTKNAPPKLRAFVAALGDKQIDAVTRDDIRDWRDALSDMDLAPNTIRLRFKYISSMFKWARIEKLSSIDNPTIGLAPKGEDTAREAFKPDDLAKLFAAPLFIGHWRADRRERPGSCLVRDAKYWLPLIALHAGMRAEEIAKLKTADVREIDGVWCFDIYETKTTAGTRQVPLHPRLIDLGLLDYARCQKSEQLWPELPSGNEGRFSQRFCQWWAGFRHLIGVDRDGLVFHSFRHTFVSALEAAGVPWSTVALLVGHKRRDITSGTYGGKLITPAIKLDAISRVDFGVDLSGLRRAVEKATL